VPEVVGRDREQRDLTRRLDEGSSVLVTGPGGIGRSTLLAAATADRAVALELRGHAPLHAVPFLPVRLAAPQVDARLAPAALAASLAGTLASAALVVVDDLQWCDADTLELVRELSLRRQVLAAARQPWSPADHLGGDHGFAHTLELGPLDGEASRLLVARLRPAAPLTDQRRWVHDAEGVPGRLVTLAGVDAGPPSDLPEGLPPSLEDEDAVRALRLATAGDTAGAARAARRAAESAPTLWSRAELERLAVRWDEQPAVADAQRAVIDLARAGRYADALALVDTIDPAARDATTAVAAAQAAWAITDIERARLEIDRCLASTGRTPADEAELLTIRSRIAAQVDWRIGDALADAHQAVDVAPPGSAAQVAALTALGTLHLIVGEDAWRDELEQASALAAARDDVHGAVVLDDVLLFAHLLSGDAERCPPLAARMIERTQHASRAWNGYARAVALLAHLYVECDHRVVTPELDRIDAGRLTVKARQALRHVQVLTALDAGRELDAVALAASAHAEADDDSALASAYHLAAEANWLAGEPERALEAVEAGSRLPTTGHHRDVAAALIGVRASRDLEREPDEALLVRTETRFANLRAAQLEARAVIARGAESVRLFDAASAAWGAANVRARLRCDWSAADAALDAGDAADARRRLAVLQAQLDAHPLAWLQRRVAATLRRSGGRVADVRERSTATDVVERVARGQTSVAIARCLVVSVPTVETHVRQAVRTTGARNRVQAAAAMVGRAGADGRPALVATRGPDGQLHVQTRGASPPRSVRELDDLGDSPWRLEGLEVHGVVAEPADVTATVLAVARGAGISVRVSAGRADTAAELVDALERLGRPITFDEPAVEGPTPLDADSRRLLDLLADGATLTEAAAALGYSRRTVQRRLEAARRQLGVRTNREAVIATRSTT
jgi:DNA-binding NarL/FixJ family response regulator